MGFETKSRCVIQERVRAVEEKGNYQSKPELSDALLSRPWNLKSLLLELWLPYESTLAVWFIRARLKKCIPDPVANRLSSLWVEMGDSFLRCTACCRLWLVQPSALLAGHFSWGDGGHASSPKHNTFKPELVMQLAVATIKELASTFKDCQLRSVHPSISTTVHKLWCCDSRMTMRPLGNGDLLFHYSFIDQCHTWKLCMCNCGLAQ